MKDYTCENPVFSEKIRIVEVSDPGHADNVNPAPKQLLQNTLANRIEINGLWEMISSLMGSLCGYYYDTANRKITSLLPHKYENGILEFPEGAAHMEGGILVLDGINGMDVLQGVLGGMQPAEACRTAGNSKKEDE